MSKKDTVGTEAPTAPEQPTNIRSYFTKEVNDLISGMGTKEMENVMKDLINTRHWVALLKYTSMRTPLLDATLRSADPTKDAHKISWAQGALAGLCDIESYVIDLNTPRPKAEQEAEGESESKPEGVIVG